MPERERQSLGFNVVQITLLSIIVALILEHLLATLSDLGVLANPASGSVALWAGVALIFVSVLATWAGFSLTFTLATYPPNAIDFLAPFALLATMHASIEALPTDDWVMFLITIGSASGVASILLFRDRIGRGAAYWPPIILQFSIAVWDWLGAVLVAVGWLAATGLAIWISVAAIVQLIGVQRTFDSWRVYLATRDS